ncbi:hypothetical protein [Nitrosomonas sp. ANs5]
MIEKSNLTSLALATIAILRQPPSQNIGILQTDDWTRCPRKGLDR